MDQSDDQKKGFKTDRIKALTDGVFGIAMTLLVLDVKESAGQGQVFWEQFRPILDKLFPYIISFLILGIYWTGHHSQFYFIKHTTRMHLWLNIVLLLFVALIPFSASLLSEKKLSQFSVLVYGSNLIAVLLAFYAQWWYATHNHRLIDPKLDNRIVAIIKKNDYSGGVLFRGPGRIIPEYDGESGPVSSGSIVVCFAYHSNTNRCPGNG
ncbi:TMEM175 family protein [Spirosoma sp. KNUC1025]|uniref:TMEM175 family protein n=1 Tax=Spirosoma sp. KNUC1025 TaxID=2894082 RepID=UPI001E642EB7|nr:TMEM175 family protein [Spirosoma sp. KNUC1025]UFH57554.1 DUF1211 domain-containing protein [Spirosoma sp. KNUC1025]